MTDQEINKAIAEALGWTGLRESRFERNGGHRIGYIGAPPPSTPRPCGVSVPDFVNDLNAMHEAEKVALRERAAQIRYLDHLPIHEWDQVHATARQRAEAFLKTFGKWRIA